MVIDTFLGIAAFAISLGGLVPVFFFKNRRKEVVLAVIVAALVVTTGVALYRVYQHEKLTNRVEAEIIAKLNGHDSVFWSLSGENKEDACRSGHDTETLNCTRDGVLVFFYEHPYCKLVVEEPNDRPAFLDGNVNEEIAGKQGKLNLFIAVLPLGENLLQGEEAFDLFLPQLLRHHLFVSGAGGNGVPVR